MDEYCMYIPDQVNHGLQRHSATYSSLAPPRALTKNAFPLHRLEETAKSYLPQQQVAEFSWIGRPESVEYEYYNPSAKDLCLLTLAWLGTTSFWVVLLHWLAKAVF